MLDLMSTKKGIARGKKLQKLFWESAYPAKEKYKPDRDELLLAESEMARTLATLSIIADEEGMINRPVEAFASVIGGLWCHRRKTRILRITEEESRPR